MFTENTFDFLFSDFIFNGTLNILTMSSMMKCASVCMTSYGCTSFFYNQNLESCLLSLTRYKDETGLIPQAGYDYFRMPSVLDRACVTAADCPFKNSRCSNSKCDCYLGYSYDSSHTTCVKGCVTYGDRYSPIVSAAVKRCNIRTYYTTAEDCMRRCTEQTSFVCKNMDFSTFSGQCHQCNIAWYGLSSIGRQYGQTGWIVYHRHCANA